MALPAKNMTSTDPDARPRLDTELDGRTIVTTAPTSVPPSDMASSSPSYAPTKIECQPERWIGFDGEVCGECSALVNTEDNGGTCESVCELQGHDCIAGWNDELNEGCSEGSTKRECSYDWNQHLLTVTGKGHALRKGLSTGNCLEQGGCIPRCADDYTSLAVRCCSSTPVEEFSNEWCPDVWQATPNCDNFRYDQAVLLCALSGGRVCTADEVERDCVRSSGCSFDGRMIWTSDVCDVGRGTSDAICECALRPPSNLTTDHTPLKALYVSHTVRTATKSLVGRADCRETGTDCQPQCAADRATHQVRCCSSIALDGWSNDHCDDVWHDSLGCYELQYEDATRMCSVRGGRLCTFNEVERGCIAENIVSPLNVPPNITTEGCSAVDNFKLMWTKDTCQLVLKSNGTGGSSAYEPVPDLSFSTEFVYMLGVLGIVGTLCMICWYCMESPDRIKRWDEGCSMTDDPNDPNSTLAGSLDGPIRSAQNQQNRQFLHAPVLKGPLIFPESQVIDMPNVVEIRAHV